MARCGHESTIPFRYIDPELRLTLEQIRRIRYANLQVLLPRKKLQLVLDLDHTLIHATHVKKLKNRDRKRIKSEDDVYEIMGGSFIVKLRPGIREFLQEVSSMFDVSIYTMGRRGYANEIRNLLVSKVGFPKDSWVISREDCVVNEQKRLDVVLSHERVVLIVDDKPEVWGHSCGKKNVVKIEEYNFFRVKKRIKGAIDTELARVSNTLKGVHASFFKKGDRIDYSRKDVRRILKSIVSPKVNDSVVDTSLDSKGDVQTISGMKLVIKIGGKRLTADNDIYCYEEEMSKNCDQVLKRSKLNPY